MLAVEAAKLVVTEAEKGSRFPLMVTGGQEGPPEGLDLQPGDRLRQRRWERGAAWHRRRIDRRCGLGRHGRGAGLTGAPEGIEVDRFHSNRPPFGPVDRPLDDVFEFADVARPGMGFEHLKRLGRELRRRITPDLAPHPAGEMPGEDGDVFLPLAERRHMEDLERQPVEKILLETPGPGEGGEIGVGGGADANVDPHRPRAPHPFERTVLHHAEKLFLGLQWHQSNLVEEERAAIGRLKSPRPFPGGAGERPLLVPEQLRLDQRRC